MKANQVSAGADPAPRADCPNCPCCWAFVCAGELWDDWYGDQEPPDPPCPCETAPVPAPTPTEVGERFNTERTRQLQRDAEAEYRGEQR